MIVGGLISSEHMAFSVNSLNPTTKCYLIAKLVAVLVAGSGLSHGLLCVCLWLCVAVCGYVWLWRLGSAVHVRTVALVGHGRGSLASLIRGPRGICICAADSVEERIGCVRSLLRPATCANLNAEPYTPKERFLSRACAAPSRLRVPAPSSLLLHRTSWSAA